MARLVVGTICTNTKTPFVQYVEAARLMKIQVDGKDHGRIVGKKGFTVSALDTLLHYAGRAESSSPISINLKDPETRYKGPPALFKPRTNWDKAMISDMIHAILMACFKAPGDFLLKGNQPAQAHLDIALEKYLQTPLSDPPFDEAVSTIVHAAGMARGVSITTSFTWK